MVGARVRLTNAPDDNETRFADGVELCRRLNLAGLTTLSVGAVLLIVGIVHHTVHTRQSVRR